MGDRDLKYKLLGIIELDDAFIGGKKKGKRGRVANGKVSVIIACGANNDRPSFIAMKAVESVKKETITQFTKQYIAPSSVVNTDAFCANIGIASIATHVPIVAPAILVDEWLPWAHVAVTNLKDFH